MSIVVFAGPTLRHAEVTARLDAVVLGPAAFGDVYRAAHSRPTAIAIIDGYFERVPAIWHKEILWAMSEGVHVFGASSMGALRAAELCDFGMVGVGSIFEAFRDGTLEDDDEVAVAHGQADTGFLPASEAMVNIRATLERAAREAVASPGSCARLLELAKRTFYAERSYPTLFESARADGMDSADLARLQGWLREGGRVDQKRRDAEQLLEHLERWQRQKPPPLRVRYAFEQTDAWHEAQRIATQAMPTNARSDDEGLLDELKLKGGYASARANAVAHGWSLEAARRAGVRADALSVRTAVETFRRDQGLLERQAFERWREEQRLDDASLTRFFEDLARASWAEPLGEALARAHLKACLQSSGQYGDLARRAEEKARLLGAVGLASPSLADARVDEAELWRWYFERLGSDAPPKDLETFARSAGFADAEELRRAALRELCYARATASGPADGLFRGEI